MSEQLVRADYDEATGISTVTVNSKWGKFTRTVKVHEEDKDIANKWDGPAFAHYLCKIDVIRAKARAMDERAIALRHGAKVLYNAAKTTTIWNYSGDSMLELYCLAEDFEKQAENLRNIANEMKAKYPEMVKHQQDKRKRMQERNK